MPSRGDVPRETQAPADGVGAGLTPDVPRETEVDQQEADAVLDAGAVFGPRLKVARAYAQHLSTTGVDHGLIGPREAHRLWSRHLVNCAVVSELVPAGASVLDVGSGAGLPGLPLAIARPDLRVVLVEPLLRRTTWLTAVVADLGVDVEVVRARAEELHGARRADVVTSRAVAPLGRLARWCLPLLAPGGRMLAIKGRGAAAEAAAAAVELRRLGADRTDVVRCGMAYRGEGTTVVRVTRA